MTSQFLADHPPSLNHLSAWTLVVLAPRHLGEVTPCQRAFERFRAVRRASAQPTADIDLRWYCTTRHTVEQQRFECLSGSEVARFRDVQRQFGPSLDELYRQWQSRGDEVNSPRDVTPVPSRSEARLEFRYLPHR